MCWCNRRGDNQAVDLEDFVFWIESRSERFFGYFVMGILWVLAICPSDWYFFDLLGILEGDLQLERAMKKWGASLWQGRPSDEVWASPMSRSWPARLVPWRVLEPRILWSYSFQTCFSRSIFSNYRRVLNIDICWDMSGLVHTSMPICVINPYNRLVTLIVRLVQSMTVRVYEQRTLWKVIFMDY